MHLAQRALPRFVITLGLREVYGDPARLRVGTDRRYHDLALRAGNRQAIAQVAQVLVGLNETGHLQTDIPRLKTPTLLMWGDRDRWIPASLADRWKMDVPHIRVKIYAGVGHVPMEEIPERSALDAHRFLSDPDAFNLSPDVGGPCLGVCEPWFSGVKRGLSCKRKPPEALILLASAGVISGDCQRRWT